MSTAVSVSMQEAAISISDWLLSFLKARNIDLYSVVYQKMLAALEKKPLDAAVFNLLLEHHEQVLNILKDVKHYGSVTMKVPNQNIHDGRGDWIEKVKKSNEVLREAEEFFIVLLQMAIYFDEQDGGQSKLGDILFEITRRTGELTEFRLKLIMFAYNMLPVDSNFRWATFKTFLSYAAKTNLFHLAVPYLDLVDEWQKEWNLEGRQKRELYGLISEQLQRASAATDAVTETGSASGTTTKRHASLIRFQRRYVEACNGEGYEILNLSETINAAVALVETSLKETEVSYFDRILSLDAVRHLKTTEHARLVELLEIFVRGKPSDLEAFRKRNLQLFDGENGLNYEECAAKCRLLTLTTLAGESALSSSASGTGEAGTLKIADLSAKLGLTESETEQLLVQTIGQKLIDGKIDQINKIVTVTSAMQREFGRPQWELILERLVAWNENTRKVVVALKQHEVNGATPLPMTETTTLSNAVI